MSDMIRKSDALEAVAGWEIPSTAIATLPAVTVGVKPLVWRDSYGVLRAETPFGDYKVSGRILYRPGNLAPQSAHLGTAEAQAAAQADYEARILAALEPVVAPDPAALTEQLAAAHQDADEAEAYAWQLEQRLATCEKYRDASADRIEALVRQVKDEQAAKFKMRDERDAAKIAASNYADFNHTWRKRAERLEVALREIAAEASVTVHTWKNGINFKKMYEGWRKIAVERIDIARAALTETAPTDAAQEREAAIRECASALRKVIDYAAFAGADPDEVDDEAINSYADYLLTLIDKSNEQQE